MILKKIRSYLMVISTLLCVLLPTLAIEANAYACTDVNGNINSGVNTAFGSSSGCSTPAGGSTSIASIAKTIVNILSLIVGIAAVIMIIYGGFRYITSGGESGAVGNAKNTIIYAVVGLILVALAQTIVHFVLNAASGTVTSG